MGRLPSTASIGQTFRVGEYTRSMIHLIRPLPVDSIKLLVFDLDGTLIDSTMDLCNSVNAMLAHVGRPSLPDELITSFIGDGVQMLVRRALLAPLTAEGSELGEEQLTAALLFFLDYYRAHKLDFTYAYKGVLETLAAIQHLPNGQPRKMAVLTNKPVGPSKAICEALGMSPFFFRIYGGDSFAVKKPDPLGLRTLMDEADALPHETLMIGDSKVDICTARNAGAWALGCTFGLAPLTLKNLDLDALADEPSDWAHALHPQTNDPAEKIGCAGSHSLA